jgi:hypothetical protein
MHFLRIYLMFFLLCSGIGFAQNSNPDTAAASRLEKQIAEEEEKDNEPEKFYEPIFKPTFGLGLGNFTFMGDVGNSYKGFHSLVSRIGYELKVNHPLTDYLDLGFYVIFGKISANERDGVRNLNFESQIRTGGAILSYNFLQLLSLKHEVQPYIFAGFESFEFLSKTDLFDQYGNRYNYWSDGSIRNIAENSPNAENSILIQRDYTYESDLREQNLDGFGKYRERSWSVPIGVGVQFMIGKRMNFKIGTSLHFTFTDLVDNVSSESIGTRAGNSKNDKFMYSSFSLNYDLMGNQSKKKKQEPKLEDDDGGYYVMDLTDLDNDGVRDFKDDCLNTPSGVPVDGKGCPLDKDNDYVPDYRDDELPTKKGNFVNEKGVTLTDADFELMYLRFIDSTGQYHGGFSKIDREEVGNGEIMTKNGIVKPKQGLTYYVIIDSEKKKISANDLYKYLSQKDFRQIESGDTIYYVIGNYNSIAEALKVKNDLENKGIKPDGVGQTDNKNNENKILSEKEIAEKLAIENSNKVFPSSKEGILYRVQIGAFDKKLSPKIFKEVPDVINVTTPDGITRYFSGSFSTIEKAAEHKINMLEKGFESSFIVAYKNGERIPLDQAGAHMVNENDKDNIKENDAIHSKVDPEKVKFRVQLGAFKNDIPAKLLDIFLEVGNVKLKRNDMGLTIYLVGNESGFDAANILKNKMVEMGVKDAFVVGEYNGSVIPAQDAIILLQR